MTARTVILAAGDFPRRGSPAYDLLERAGRVVCCDSAADTYRRRFGREPFAVVGDCDSVRGRFEKIVRIDEQETNDLAKAVAFCRANGWRNPVLLGVTGRREDHAIGNIFRALDYGLEIVTDHGRFVPFEGRRVFNLRPGSPVSVFATDPATRMTSEGLVWPLNDVRFENLYCATLNRTNRRRVVLTATRRVFVYLAF